VSFATREVVGSATEDQTVRIQNEGTTAVTYVAIVDLIVDAPGVGFSFAKDTVTVPSGGYADITISLSATASLMLHQHDETDADDQNGWARHYVSEEAGYLVLAPTGGGASVLRVPLYAALRAASDMAAASDTLALAKDTTQIDLAGTGFDTGGTDTTDVKSLVAPFELAAISPDEDDTDVPNFLDLAYVGVTSDAIALKSDARVYFAVATQEDWSSPNLLEVDVFIDTDQDGETDYVLFNTNAGWGDDPLDVFLTVLYDVAGDEYLTAILPHVNFWEAHQANTAPFMTNVMVLPAVTDDLGLTKATVPFDYRVAIYDLDDVNSDDVGAIGLHGYDPTDETGWLTFDPANPGFDFTGGTMGMPTFDDQDGGAIPADYDLAAITANNTLGVLLLHFHNTVGNRAEVVKIDGVTPELVCTPDTLTVGAEAGSDHIAVENAGVGTMTWTAEVTSGEAWLSIATAKVEGDGTITVSFTQNSSADPRSGAILVEAPGVLGSPVTITVDQEGCVAPDAPTNVAATDGIHSDKVAVTWDAAAGATDYMVYRCTTDSFATATAVSGWVTGTSYNDTTAAAPQTSGGGCNGGGTTTYTKYYYWVVARNACSAESDPSTSDQGWRGDAKAAAAALFGGSTSDAALFAIALALLAAASRRRTQHQP